MSENSNVVLDETDQIPQQTNPVFDFPTIYPPQQTPPEPKIAIALNSNVQFVQPKFGLLLSCKLKKVEDHIKQLISEIPDVVNEVTNPEFIEIVVNQLETLISKKDSVNKEEFLIGILDKIFKLTDVQKRQISTIIEYQANRKLIKGHKGVLVNGKKLLTYLYKRIV